MIGVYITINGVPILARTAVQRGLNDSSTGEYFYEVDDGQLVAHVPGDGAVALAKKLLDTIKEQKPARAGDGGKGEGDGK